VDVCGTLLSEGSTAAGFDEGTVLGILSLAG